LLKFVRHKSICSREAIAQEIEGFDSTLHQFRMQFRHFRLNEVLETRDGTTEYAQPLVEQCEPSLLKPPVSD
jgi:hypothetical protein